MRTPRLRLSLLAAVLAAVPIAGCSGSSSSAQHAKGLASKSAAEIIAAAERAIVGARTVHITGLVPKLRAHVRIDMYIVQDVGASGSVSYGPYSCSLILVRNRVYVNGNTAFYEHFAGRKIARMARGRWLEGARKHGKLLVLANLTELHSMFYNALDEHGPLSRGPITYVVGQKVIELRDKTYGGGVDVALEGEPYPIEVLAKGGVSNEGLTFNHWNRPVELKRPPNPIPVEKLN